MSLIETFFHKENKLSKTAIILSVTTFIVLGLYLFQSLFSGSEFFGWWTVPGFDPSAGVTILFAVSTLYVANHKLRSSAEVITPEQVAELRDKVDVLVDSVSGDNNDN